MADPTAGGGPPHDACSTARSMARQGTPTPTPPERPTVVVTDSAASLPQDVAGRAGLLVVPMSLVVAGTRYDDGDLPASEVLGQAGAITTSGPSPGEFVKAVEAVDPGSGVLIVTVASQMSSTYEAARVAAGYLDPTRVRLIDSGTAAGAQGLVVLAALERANAGATLDEVATRAGEVAGAVHLLAGLHSLEHLARSGHVPGIAARAGQSLGVRPMFEFADGQAHAKRPALSHDAVLERLVDTCLRTRGPGQRLHAAVLHAEAEADATELDHRLRRAVPGDEMAAAYIAPFSSVMVAHTGPGLVGLAWWWEPGRRDGG